MSWTTDWTKEKPTEEGYYWLIENPEVPRHRKEQIVRVGGVQGDFCAAFVDYDNKRVVTLSVNDPSLDMAIWAGPIAPPK
jgi:hypothetical protein